MRNEFRGKIKLSKHVTFNFWNEAASFSTIDDISSILVKDLFRPTPRFANCNLTEKRKLQAKLKTRLP